MTDLFIPTKKLQKFIRPLNKGVRKDLPSTQMPDGSFLTIDGFIPQPYGLRRRPATARYGVWAVDFAPIQGLWTVRTVSGTSYSILMDRRKVYVINTSSITPLDWTYTTGTVGGTAGDATIAGTDTAWATQANWILAGDRIAIADDPGGAGSQTETDNNGDEITTRMISSITDGTHLELETALPTGFSPSGADYTIYRSVGASSIATPVNVNDSLYFTDGQRPIQIVTSTSWGLLNSDTWCPYAIAYFADRLWAADIIDSDGTFGGDSETEFRYRQMIAWSNLGVGNLATFSTDTDFLNLPYGFGAIRRLMPMSQFLVAYFTDSIWLGQRSNLQDLPFEFTRFETGGMGALTPNAITPFFDGHFFIGQDDVYYLSARTGVEPIGTPVIRDMLKRITSVNEVRAVTDYSTSTAIFGIPTVTNSISELWRFNWKTKAWSSEDRDADFIGVDTILETISWDTLDSIVSPDEWGGFIYNDTWDSILTEAAWNQQLYFSAGTQLYYYLDDSGTIDRDTGLTPPGIIVTGDLDMDAPDINKVWTKFTLELEEPLQAADDDLHITLEGSVDKGRKWKTLGTIIIGAEYDEGALDFRLTGPTARFRMTMATNETHQPYSLGGIGLTFKVLGTEVQGRS